MRHDIRTLCFDILQAIGEIRQFTSGLSFEEYQKNRLVKLAVERTYEIIGEALKRMNARFGAEFATITDGRKIIDLRNILSHGYDQIADEIVWAITREGLDTLEQQTANILGKYNE